MTVRRHAPKSAQNKYSEYQYRHQKASEGEPTYALTKSGAPGGTTSQATSVRRVDPASRQTPKPTGSYGRINYSSYRKKKIQTLQSSLQIVSFFFARR